MDISILDTPDKSDIHIFVWIYDLILGKYLGVAWPSHMIGICLTSKELPNVF